MTCNGLRQKLHVRVWFRATKKRAISLGYSGCRLSLAACGANDPPQKTRSEAPNSARFNTNYQHQQTRSGG